MERRTRSLETRALPFMGCLLAAIACGRAGAEPAGAPHSLLEAPVELPKAPVPLPQAPVDLEKARADPPEKPAGEDLGLCGVYSVLEISFEGPEQGPEDSPARDVDLLATFRHESGTREHAVCGFWDGDGRGGLRGRAFKVRFSPTLEGRWDLVLVRSRSPELDGQRQGSHVTALASGHRGFWVADPESPGRRWYARSDGSHQYIIGNTHYSFLSGRERGGKPSGNDIARDIAGNARYFKKLRFGLSGDYYPDPDEKPFLDEAGRPTDSGDFSHRPNVGWFGRRVDLAVRAAFERDLIADLILAGPDTEDSRSTLRAARNGGDATPFLRYVAARYGSFPNVWICLSNEFDIRKPHFDEKEIAALGRTIRELLPYPTPLSVHATPGLRWPAAFDALPPWHDHQIIQEKVRTLAAAADGIRQVAENPGGPPRRMPTINDELSYQGAGDEHSEGDTVEAHLGAFLGGGYGTTGEKPGAKIGQYFRGKFDPSEHTAAESLRWLRETIDAHVIFWKLSPDLSIFSGLDPDARGLSWPGREYVLGTSRRREGIVADLPSGAWDVTRHDVISRESTTLARGASGRFAFDAPESRAVLLHFKRRSPPAGLRLLERRVDAREKTEAESDVPSGCVITGIGGRADVDNLTTLHVEYREILDDGSLGPARELRLGSDPDHACEARISLPEGWVAVGFGARGAPEWDVATLRVWGRRWRTEGDDGEVRAWSAGREPEAGLERSVLVKEPDRALIGAGLRFHQNDIQGIYARSARVLEAPEGDRSIRARGAADPRVADGEAVDAGAADGVPVLRLRRREMGPVPLGALDADRLQEEILDVWRRGARELRVDSDGVPGTSAEPLIGLVARLLDDPFRAVDLALREVIAERVGEGCADRAARAASRGPLIAKLAFAAAGRPFLGEGGAPGPADIPDAPADRGSLDALRGEKESARWLLAQSRAELDALLGERDDPWLRSVRADLELLSLAVDLWERLATAEILSRVYLIDGAEATRREAREALGALETEAWGGAFGDPSALREIVAGRLSVEPRDTRLGRVSLGIEELSGAGDPESSERAAARLAELMDDGSLRPYLAQHWTTLGRLATGIAAFGIDRGSLRVLWGGDGRWRPEKRAGRWSLVRSPEGPCVYIDVLGSAPRARLSFEYLDDREGRIHVHYSSVDPESGLRDDYRPAPPVPMEGTGSWRRAEVLLDGCAFGDRQNMGADLRLIPSEVCVAIRAPRIERR